MSRVIMVSLALIAVLVCFAWTVSSARSPEQIGMDEAWSDFATEINALGDLVSGMPTSWDERSTAAGYRSLARLLSTAVANFTDFANPNYPQFKRFPNAVARIGWDNPDNVYLSAHLRGDHTYKITGNLRGAQFVSFNVYSGTLGYTPMDEMRQITGLASGDMVFNEDGSFEVILSPVQQEGNWMKLEPDAQNVIIRQVYADWSKPLAHMSIINMTTLGMPAPEPTPAEIKSQLQESIKFVAGVRGILNWAHRGLFQLKLDANEINDPKVSSADLPMNDPFQASMTAHFELQDDDALVIEVPPVNCQFTNIQLTNPWMESLDYASRQSSLNIHSAHKDTDGWTRYVVSHQDPGVPNWLDTANWEKGSLFARWTYCEGYPKGLKSQVVKLAQLRAVLPKTTPVISMDQRRAVIAERQMNYARRFADR